MNGKPRAAFLSRKRNGRIANREWRIAIMLLYFHKIEQATKQGIEQGRSENHREWSDWNTRRQEAEAKGIPFNEPPPPNPNGVKKETD